MSTVKAIKFRYLESKLDQTERIKFTTRLVQQSSNVIKDALFLYFLQSVNGESENNNVNELLSEIIASRKQKQRTDETKSNLKIDTLPNQLIGSIASYMKQKDYINFSKANRCVYLGCNTPNLMQELDLLKVADYSCVNLSLYRSVQVLRFKLRSFTAFKFPANGSKVMSQLQSIKILGERKIKFDINGFLATMKKRIHVARVSRLELSNFGCCPNNKKFDVDQFYKLLSLFPHIQYLMLFIVNLNVEIDLNKMYPKLVGLGLTMLRPIASNMSLLGRYGNRLSHLNFAERDDHLDLSQINFSKLESLSLLTMNTKTLCDIVKTARNLKKICVYLRQWNPPNTTIDPSVVKHGIIESVASNKMLRFLQICCKPIGENMLRAVLEGLEQGLFETKEYKRKQMQIIIKIKKVVCLKEFVMKIGNILHWLELFVDSFVLMFASKTDANKAGIVKDIQGISGITTARYIDDLKLLVISNQFYNIDGFQVYKFPQ